MPAQTEVIEYYGQDALGSVRIVFNSSGVATARADFEPFGELFTVPGMPGGQLPAQQFTGQERDAEASQDYFGARFLTPRTERFSQVDPVYAGLCDPQQWNRYGYARNNPLSFTDPTGMNVEGPRQPAYHVEIWGCASCLEDFFLQQLIVWVGWGWGGGGGGNGTGTDPGADGGVGVDLTPTTSTPTPTGGEGKQARPPFKKGTKKLKKATTATSENAQVEAADAAFKDILAQGTESCVGLFGGPGLGQIYGGIEIRIVRPLSLNGYQTQAQQNAARNTAAYTVAGGRGPINVIAGGAFFHPSAAVMVELGNPALLTYQASVLAHEYTHAIFPPQTHASTAAASWAHHVQVWNACFKN